MSVRIIFLFVIIVELCCGIQIGHLNSGDVLCASCVDFVNSDMKSAIRQMNNVDACFAHCDELKWEPEQQSVCRKICDFITVRDLKGVDEIRLCQDVGYCPQGSCNGKNCASVTQVDVFPNVVQKMSEALISIQLKIFESYGPGTIRIRIVPKDVEQPNSAKIYNTQALSPGLYSISASLEDIVHHDLVPGAYSIDVSVCEKRCGSAVSTTLATSTATFYA